MAKGWTMQHNKYGTWFLRSLVVMCTTLTLSGCLEPSVEQTKPEEAQSIVDGLTYVKSKNGLCFGVGTTSRIDTGGKLSYTVQLVNVPCDVVGLKEEK